MRFITFASTAWFVGGLLLGSAITYAVIAWQIRKALRDMW